MKQKNIACFPHDKRIFMNTLQIGELTRWGPTTKNPYNTVAKYPRMQSGWINDKVRTIIPAWARAEIDVRLVLESDPERLIQLIRKHVEGQGYYVVN